MKSLQEASTTEVQGLTLTDFRSEYATLAPQIGNYDRIWRILRNRARKTGWFPQKLHGMLSRFFHPSKPYFIGQTGDNVRFLGDYRDYYSVRWAVQPDFDTDIVHFLCEQSKQITGVVLDVGANMGITASAIAKSRGNEVQVVAFEPTRETALRTAATFALNDLNNVCLFRIAVGDTDGALPFFVPEGYSETASAIQIDQRGGVSWQQTEVACRMLDSLMQTEGWDPVRLIKIDVEGYEPQVIRGARNLLARDKPTVVYEYNAKVARKIGWGVPDITPLFPSAANYGYRVWSEGWRDFPPPPEAQDIVNIVCSPTTV